MERILENAHLRALHGGPHLTLSVLRLQYWLLSARSAVRPVVHRCVVCTRYHASTAKQLMANLASARVTPSRPFSRVTVNCARPATTHVAWGRGL